MISSVSTSNRMPPDLAAKIAAMGPVIDPPATHALYAPLHDREPYPGAVVTRDVAYGPDPLNVLDVFAPERAPGRPLPVLVYVHGGGFERGDKHTAGTPFSDNVPLWAARHGMLGVNINYRLAPKAHWPSGPQDVGAALAWVKASAARFGGDPARVYLLSTSAGANHVASYIAFREFQRADASPVAGAMFISGTPFDLSTYPMQAFARYFGDEASRYAALSPTPGLIALDIPLLVAWAGFDPERIAQQSVDLVAALEKAGRKPRAVFLKTHGHISGADSIGTADTELSEQILALVTGGR
jgi:triacylglycerol lipase